MLYVSNDINFLEKGMYFSFARESASITLWTFEHYLMVLDVKYLTKNYDILMISH